MPISELVSVYSECSIVSMARSVKVKGNQLKRITLIRVMTVCKKGKENKFRCQGVLDELL
jgi:hypothetical protein